MIGVFFELAMKPEVAQQDCCMSSLYLHFYVLLGYLDRLCGPVVVCCSCSFVIFWLLSGLISSCCSLCRLSLGCLIYRCWLLFTELVLFASIQERLDQSVDLVHSLLVDHLVVAGLVFQYASF